MISWWQHLSWSAATVVAIVAIWLMIMGFLALCAASAALGLHDRPLAPHRNRRTPQRRRGEPEAETREPPWPVENYDAKRREKVQWLGDRHLLARPVRRLGVPSDSIGKVIRFDRGRK